MTQNKARRTNKIDFLLTTAWGAGGLRFKSGRPDHLLTASSLENTAASLQTKLESLYNARLVWKDD